MNQSPALARRLGTGDAVVVELSAMVGAGVFVAMARERDLPGWLASVHPGRRVLDHAQLVVGAAIVVLVLLVDLRGAIGFSSFGVLVYYAIANASALRQPFEQRRWPRALNVLGLLGCLTLAATLPGWSVVAGLVVFAVGLTGRAVALARRPPRHGAGG